jgi:2-methylcitrate dehydratase PrpD
VRAAIVEIATSDGRHFKILVDRVPGAPYNPLSPSQVEEKFLSLSIPALGEPRSQSVVRTVRNLETHPDVASLAELMRKS